MRLKVLALDYDGTIAEDGALNPDVRAAIHEIRARGITVVLVTGRILADLRRVAGDLRFVDAVVGENGAVYTMPGTARASVLGLPPSPRFLAELKRRHVRVDVGECVVEADAAAAESILQVIRDLELPLILAFNRGRLMVLPQSISKATGLREALTALRLSVHNAIGIGDAENDHDLLQACEVGAAVGWGSRSLRAAADDVIEGSGPAAVADYIRGLAADGLRFPRIVRRRLLLGQGDDGRPVALGVKGRNVLVSGEPRSGKSWVAGLLCEQLILHGYSVCVIDPEGDYTSLEPLPNVVVLGGGDPLPRPREIIRRLRHPDVSVVIDLSQKHHREKIEYVRGLLPVLTALRRHAGVPHRVLLDEAHYFLHGPQVEPLLDSDLQGYTLVTYRASALDPRILAASGAVIVSGESDPREVEALARLAGVAAGEEWHRVLGSLDLGEAVVLPMTDEAEGRLRRVRLVERMTPHVRHRAKYFDVPVGDGQEFVFTDNGVPTGNRAHTLKEFVDVVAAAAVPIIEGHLARGDFARWIADVYGDHPLAVEFRRVQSEHAMRPVLALNDAIVELIRERYEIDA